MNGKTNNIRRRLSIVALAASIAAVAIPAASAGAKYFGPGSNTAEKHGPYGVYWVPMHRVLGPGLNTVQKQGPYGAYWIRKHEAARVLGPGLNTVEKRGPYGAYWIPKATQKNRTFSPSVVHDWFPHDTLVDDWFRNITAETLSSQTISTSVVDRTLGSPDPRDTYREVLGDAGFGIQNPNVQDVFAPTAAIEEASANWAAKAKLLDVNGQPRLHILESAAIEHGAAGFGNSTQIAVWTPVSVDYSHLPQGDRPSGITRRGF
jgi:hypothetical protein